jgi:epoxyqueuosine reductase
VHQTWQNWIFGCDICMDVCPWNRFSKPHNEPKFEPNDAILGYSNTDWIEITEEVFKLVFKNSPVKRAKYNGFKNNIEFVKNNTPGIE